MYHLYREPRAGTGAMRVIGESYESYRIIFEEYFIN
jgi:hypothetical protein